MHNRQGTYMVTASALSPAVNEFPSIIIYILMAYNNVFDTFGIEPRTAYQNA